MRSVQTAKSDKNESEGSNSNMIKRPAHECTYVRLAGHVTSACQTGFLSRHSIVRVVVVEAATARTQTTARSGCSKLDSVTQSGLSPDRATDVNSSFPLCKRFCSQGAISM